MEISEVGAQTPGRPRTQSSSETRNCVVISGTQRDALYALIMSGFGELGDLERASREDDVETCYRLGRRLVDALRLIVDGGLGWGETTGQETVHLTLPPRDLQRILSDMRRGAVGFQEGVRPEYEDKRDEWEWATLARDTCTEALEQLTEPANPPQAKSQ